MIIGNFKHDQDKDIYAGEIRTLTLHRTKVTLGPIEAKSEKGPHHHVMAEGTPGSVELGAAWKRKSEAGRNFLSVTLGDPALRRTLNAALMPSEDGTGGILIWSRPTKRMPLISCSACSVTPPSRQPRSTRTPAGQSGAHLRSGSGDFDERGPVARTQHPLSPDGPSLGALN